MRRAEQLCNPTWPPSGGALSDSTSGGQRAKRVGKDWREKFWGRATGGHEVHTFRESTKDCLLCKGETGNFVVAHLNCRTCQVNFCQGKCLHTWYESG